jgi:hypothetical protein
MGAVCEVGTGLIACTVKEEEEISDGRGLLVIGCFVVTFNRLRPVNLNTAPN